MENQNSLYLTLTDEEKKSLLEALIFASDEPMTHEALIRLLFVNDGEPEFDEIAKNAKKKSPSNDGKFIKEHLYIVPEFQKFVDEINQELAYTNRPYRIVNFAGGWSFATNKEYGELVSNFYRSKSKRKLSQAALETLAIVAYKQPVSKPEIEQIRGVNSNEVVNSLLDKGFIVISGRSDAPGKPLLYEVTKEFLVAFGLNSLNDLPKLRELDEFSDTALPTIDEPNIYKFKQPTLIDNDNEIKESELKDVTVLVDLADSEEAGESN